MPACLNEVFGCEVLMSYGKSERKDDRKEGYF